MKNVTFNCRALLGLTLTAVLLTALGLTPFAFAQDVCPSGCAYSTIQAAVDAVAAGSRITIKSGTYVENVYVDKELEFYGDDPDPTMTVIDGGGAGPVFNVEGTVGSEVEFTRLTITNGRAEKGGGIKSRHSTVRVVECILLDNLATSRGGGIFSKNGSLTVSKSTLEGNQAEGLADASGGGIFVRNGTARIEHSLLFENGAGDGGGGGLGNRGGEVTLDNTTVTGNYSFAGTGGGIDNRVGGELRVVFSTVFGNIAADGTGGGIHNATDSTAEIENTILAFNSANHSPECGGVLTSLDHNLMMGLGCTFVPLPGDILLTDPQLAALADNGGPTRTFALLPGSPAFDSGQLALEDEFPIQERQLMDAGTSILHDIAELRSEPGLPGQHLSLILLEEHRQLTAELFHGGLVVQLSVEAGQVNGGTEPIRGIGAWQPASHTLDLHDCAVML